MSFLSDKVKSLGYSSTLFIADKVREMKADGEDIISLAVGEPDFDTPENICNAAKVAIDSGYTKYPPVSGDIDLKKAVVEKFQKENNLHYNLNQITISNGVKQCLFNFFSAILNPGDEVIIPNPYWVSYKDVISFIGANAVIWDSKEDFSPNIDKLETIINDNTKILLLNYPCNPSGYCITELELKKIAEILIKYPKIHIISDDIYEHIIFDNKKFFNILNVAPELKDRVCVVNGLSKSYAMTGWRVGYAAGNANVIAAMCKLQSQVTSGVCSIAQKAAIEALTGDQSFLKIRNSQFQKRRDIVFKKLSIAPGLTVNKPEGAFYIFPSCENLLNTFTSKGKQVCSDIEFTEYLLKEYKVAVTPGISFGMKNFFRVSYALDEKLLHIACDKIIEACKKLVK